jgi:hypothetical protein
MPYEIKPLSCDPKTLKGLSEKLIVSHWENNYGGAVKRLNAITAQFASLDFATAPVFVAMSKAMGGRSGWVRLTYSPRDGKLVNQWAAGHTHGRAGARPMLALDMYEHSYHLDSGAAAAKYVDECRRIHGEHPLGERLGAASAAREMTKEAITMRRRMVKGAIVLVGLAAAVAPGLSLAADPDWKAVEQALGKSGQVQAGDVFRVGMPRTDLAVTVKGVTVKAGFALGSYAAFKQVGDHTMVMGDLVLLDQEVPAVMSGLLSGGLEVTAVHNHLNEMSPHVMYMHYEGHGDAVQMAKALRQALSASGTPLGAAGAAPAASGGPALDTKQIEQVLGRSGRDIGGGVFQVTAPRAEAISGMGVPLLPAMGVVTVMNFQPTADGKAAITGDFVLVDKEVNPVARALRQHGIDVTAIHNHGLQDTPRLFYMHFWATDDVATLARGLRAALDQTNSAKP